jgi:hypothetical protein
VSLFVLVVVPFSQLELKLRQGTWIWPFQGFGKPSLPWFESLACSKETGLFRHDDMHILEVSVGHTLSDNPIRLPKWFRLLPIQTPFHFRLDFGLEWLRGAQDVQENLNCPLLSGTNDGGSKDSEESPRALLRIQSASPLYAVTWFVGRVKTVPRSSAPQEPFSCFLYGSTLLRGSKL